MSCIYRIRNLIDNKCYIGSTSYFSRRKSAHINSLNKNQHHSIKLQRAYNKYGKTNFIIEIIEECLSENKLELELKYFELLRPEYNIAAHPLAPMQGRKHASETITKLMGRSFPKEKCWLYGKKWTQEFREKVIKARTGLKRDDSFKEKQRINAIDKNLAKCLTVYTDAMKKQVIDSNGVIFNSLSDCSKHHNISVATVCDILKGRHSKTRKGISFKYYENT